MQGVTDVQGLISEPLRGDVFLFLCSHFVYVQAGNKAAGPPVAMTGQLGHSPCLSHAQHCNVFTNRVGHVGHGLQPPELGFTCFCV